MNWKDQVNTAMSRVTGYELRKVGPRRAGKRAAAGKPRTVGKLRSGDRLVDAPVFVMCTLRSGSTLLRVLLNSHSQIHAPHELHLRYIDVQHEAKWSDRSMRELGLDDRALEYLLWDRILHRELVGSGKRMIVDKTPNNVFIADRIRECWPDSRFIFLLRHPAAIAASRKEIKGEDFDDAQNVDLIRRYCEALESARQTYDGHTIRYEELATDPAKVTQGICSFLRVPWEAGMLDYGSADHGRFKAGLGDWSEKIKAGTVQPPKPPPAEIPEPLLPIAATWGYAPAGATQPAG